MNSPLLVVIIMIALVVGSTLSIMNKAIIHSIKPRNSRKADAPRPTAVRTLAGIMKERRAPAAARVSAAIALLG